MLLSLSAALSRVAFAFPLLGRSRGVRVVAAREADPKLESTSIRDRRAYSCAADAISVLLDSIPSPPAEALLAIPPIVIPIPTPTPPRSRGNIPWEP